MLFILGSFITEGDFGSQGEWWRGTGSTKPGAGDTHVSLYLAWCPAHSVCPQRLHEMGSCGRRWSGAEFSHSWGQLLYSCLGLIFLICKTKISYSIPSLQPVEGVLKAGDLPLCAGGGGGKPGFLDVHSSRLDSYSIGFSNEVSV